MNPGSAVPPQIAILGVSSILIELVVLAIYAAISHRARAMVRRPAFAMSLNRAGGIPLIGAGARMAMIHRS